MDDNEELARLLAEAQEGNEQSLGDLLAQLRPWMCSQTKGQLGQRLRSLVDTSDIVHEVYVRARKSFFQFRGGSVPKLKAWIKTILRNIIADHNRGRNDVEMAGRDLLADVPGDGTTPSQGAMRNEDQARIIEALQRLPEKDRLVVQLRVYEGLSFKEIAQKMCVTVGDARVRMLRAIEKLQGKLEDEHE